MRVFISGATGVLGRRVVDLLAERGEQVVGLSRSAANSEWLTQHGAEARRGDLSSAAQLIELTADCDAMLHLATAIPTRTRTILADWAANDRIRRDGTRAMVAAALRNSCQVYVQASVTFIYGDRQGGWVDESATLPAQQAQVLQSALEMEEIVRQAGLKQGLPAIVLRYGTFYSPDSAQTQAMLTATRKGLFPLIGGGMMYWNMIHVDDAASALVKSLENYARGVGQTFNVCDDEPVTLRDLTLFVADKLGAGKPRRLPTWLGKTLLGKHVAEVMLASVRCRNGRIKAALGWSPQYATYREGYAAVIAQWRQVKDV